MFSRTPAKWNGKRQLRSMTNSSQVHYLQPQLQSTLTRWALAMEVQLPRWALTHAPTTRFRRTVYTNKDLVWHFNLLWITCHCLDAILAKLLISYNSVFHISVLKSGNTLNHSTVPLPSHMRKNINKSEPNTTKHRTMSSTVRYWPCFYNIKKQTNKKKPTTK